MKSRAHFHANTSGFTLMELLVVLALLGFIATLGVGIGIRTYQSQIFDSQVSTLTSFLQTARNQSMNNVSQSEHGVRIEADALVLFDDTNDFPSPRNGTVTIDATDSHGDPVDEIVFTQLSGETNDDYTIVISNGPRNVTITINQNGRIDW